MIDLPNADDGKLLVSMIVRTCAGRGGMLMECLRSIDAQHYRKIEIVVVEDGSAESQARVERFLETTDLAVQYHAIEKAGRCVAGNKALEAATGSLLNFLDDDDQLYPNHVGLLEAKLRGRPDLVAVYAQALEVPIAYQSLDPLVYTEQPGRRFRGGPFSLGRLWCQNYLPIQTVMFRRELFLRHGGFDPELDRLEDWNLWVRYLSTGNAEFIDEVTSCFRVPISPRSQLQRNAEIDAYFALALGKQREVFDRMSLFQRESLAREIEQYRMTQIAIPALLRRWIDGKPLYRSTFIKSLVFAKRVVKYLRRALAVAVWPKASIVRIPRRKKASW
jgi:glycosyltransferase involved in cell wall biosynthesis